MCDLDGDEKMPRLPDQLHPSVRKHWISANSGMFERFGRAISGGVDYTAIGQAALLTCRRALGDVSLKPHIQSERLNRYAQSQSSNGLDNAHQSLHQLHPKPISMVSGNVATIGGWFIVLRLARVTVYRERPG